MFHSRDACFGVTSVEGQYSGRVPSAVPGGGRRDGTVLSQHQQGLHVFPQLRITRCVGGDLQAPHYPILTDAVVEYCRWVGQSRSQVILL